MKIQVTLDSENYIDSYSIVDESPYSELNNSITIDIDEDLQAFYYVYNAYKVEDNKATLDKDKLNEIIQIPSNDLTELELLRIRIKELEKRIELLENK